MNTSCVGIFRRGLAASAAVAAFVVPSAFAETIYNSIPAPLPPNVPSLGYQANQTAEFGELINFDGTARTLTNVSVVMSDWAKKSDWLTFGTAAGFNHNLTLNLYNVGASNTVGSLIATRTVNAFIPWRPEADPTCPGGGTAWRAGDSNCYNGLAFTVSFDFTGLNVSVPDDIIYGLAYNTQTWGYTPVGAPGPYDSLNFGLAQVAPTVGSNPLDVATDGTAYWNTATAGNYTDGGTGGVGTFRQDTNWSPYSGAIAFEAPEPGSLALLGVALAGLGFARRKKA